MTHAIGCLLRSLKFNFLELRLKWVFSALLHSIPGRVEAGIQVFPGRTVPTPLVWKEENRLLFFSGKVDHNTSAEGAPVRNDCKVSLPLSQSRPPARPDSVFLRASRRHYQS